MSAGLGVVEGGHLTEPWMGWDMIRELGRLATHRAMVGLYVMEEDAGFERSKRASRAA